MSSGFRYGDEELDNSDLCEYHESPRIDNTYGNRRQSQMYNEMKYKIQQLEEDLKDSKKLKEENDYYTSTNYNLKLSIESLINKVDKKDETIEELVEKLEDLERELENSKKHELEQKKIIQVEQTKIREQYSKSKNRRSIRLSYGAINKLKNLDESSDEENQFTKSTDVKIFVEPPSQTSQAPLTPQRKTIADRN